MADSAATPEAVAPAAPPQSAAPVPPQPAPVATLRPKKPKRTIVDALAGLKGWPLVVVVALSLAFGAFVCDRLCATVVRILEVEHKPPWLELVTYLFSPGAALLVLGWFLRRRENRLTTRIDVLLAQAITVVTNHLTANPPPDAAQNPEGQNQ
jgi:hypothetical protein